MLTKIFTKAMNRVSLEVVNEITDTVMQNPQTVVTLSNAANDAFTIISNLFS